MNIIVCNDVRREEFSGESIPKNPMEERIRINLDCQLIKDLRRKKHSVHLFDGYRADHVSAIRDPHIAANHLLEMIIAVQAAGMVYDIHYFGNFTFGLTMLRSLRSSSGIPVDMTLVVYSRFIDQYALDTMVGFGIPKERILDRNTHTIDEVVAIFD